MSKALPATCSGGVVTAEGVPVPGATVLSEGVGSSEGVLVLDESRATYIPKTSPDLKTTLTQVIAAFDSTKSALDAFSALFATMASPVWDVQPAGAAVAATAKSAADTASDNIANARALLNTLKGALR